MIEDEKQPQDDVTEGAEDRPAGPVAGEDASSSQAAGEEPTPTPPAAEASEAEDETPQSDDAGASDEVAGQDDQGSQGDGATPAAPGSEAEEAAVDETPPSSESDPSLTPSESDEGPGERSKEKKEKDVIPGADLEPIAVEQEEKRPLSAEEQARLEAEEEERAKREAELEGDEEPSAASRAPQKMEGDARFLATGKRKTSIARVTLLPGSGKIEINKRELEEFFPRPLHQTMARQPLTITGYEGSVDVRVRVHGGGISGQAGAVRHGIARALTAVDPELRGELKRRGFLTRDARAKERRKAGLKKARKRPQFSKR